MTPSYRTAARQVGVIGAGAMGSGIAFAYALAGRQVTLYSRSGRSQVTRLATQLTRLGVPGAEATLRRITHTDRLATAVAGADHLVEAVPENLEIKQEIIAELDSLAAPDVLIGSTTTALPVTGIAAKATHRDRILATHFYLPAHLVPLVDIVPGEDTAPEAVTAAREIIEGLGKTAGVFGWDAPGTIGPRLQTALLGEAFRIVAEGVAEPELVDLVLSKGIGSRFGVTGIFDRLDMAGLDTVTAILERQGKPVPPALSELVGAGHLGMKSGRGFYDWSGGRAEALDDALARHLLASPAPAEPAEVVLGPGVLAPFLEAAREEYLACTPEEPPSCFAVLVGRAEGGRYTVERIAFGRNVRSSDEVAAEEYEQTIVPCFGAAYRNSRRGFWCDSKDLLRITRDAEDDDLEVLGSIHLHPDWHQIGPPGERGMRISENPTPMDSYVLQQTGWPVNMICYFEGHAGGQIGYTLGAWTATPDSPALRITQVLPTR
ncbi:3-hydroxyacyl-CoA dehydrogenase family protein [Longispora albida]|uniref:3-hydroxyacyl-CoA dehydrogenase family protein n=1 Tax=Longispora albida TaxID=203523 RepID=UPI00035EBE98|nr:3-hydroxyacyl-CoA dehydrogenase NAD-binding domain-containing protein [Longispora albida]